MKYERYIFVGDVHGCLDELDELLRLVDYRGGRDRLVFVGDLLDRGPDPVGVVRRARELGADAVLGNHEEKHIRWRKWEAKVSSGEADKNPMRPFTGSRLDEHNALSDEDMDWLRGLPSFLRLDESWMVVHAGFETNGVAPEKQKLSTICRVRDVGEDGRMATDHRNPLAPVEGAVPWATRWGGPESVVYGHAVYDLKEPRRDDHGTYACYGIDTGCVFGGHLTALSVDAQGVSPPRYVQALAKREYFPIAKDWQPGRGVSTE